MPPVVLRGGRIRTLDPTGTVVSAVLLSSGRVARLGSDADVLAHAPDDAEIVDLGGRTVVPGLVDAHTHVEVRAYARQRWLDVRGVPRDELLARVAAAADDPSVEWVVAQATHGQERPSRAELDAAGRGRPTVVRLGMHHLLASTAALVRAGITRSTPAPVGVRIERDATGEPTGLVLEGFDLFPVDHPAPDVHADLLRTELLESYARHGVTAVYEVPATTQGMRAWQDLHRSGRLPLRASLNPVVAPGSYAVVDDIAHWSRFGLATGFGDERLWLGAAKVFLDGGYEAAYSSDHLTEPPSRWGLPTRNHQELVRLLTTAAGAGVQVWLHALGDLAQRAALDAVEEAATLVPGRDRRTRIEHAGNRWVDQTLVQRLVDAAVTPVPQPAFIRTDDGAGSYPFRTFLDAGLAPPGNSDSGGVSLDSSNPWYCMAAMVDRLTAAGTPVAPEERVTVAEALRTYTAHGARAGFAEHTIGSLEVGKHADLAVLADDPLETTKPLSAVAADRTYVGGQCVWDRATERGAPTP